MECSKWRLRFRWKRSSGLEAGAWPPNSPQTLSEINVTPFVDVVLVLLIIFMITAPMLVRSIDVSLPAVGIRQDQASERIRVTMDAQGRTYYGRSCREPSATRRSPAAMVEVRGLRVAYLRADEELKYKEIMAVIELIKNAGVDVVGMEYIYPEEKRSR